MRRQAIWRSFAVVLLPLAASGLPTPTVTLTSNSTTLQLPGTVTLTTTVNPAGAGAVPTGTVSFTSDGTTSLGTATLAPIISTQSFPSNVSLSQLSAVPYGGTAFSSSAFPNPVFATLDSYYDTTLAAPATYPAFTVYSGQGSGLLATSSFNHLGNGCACPSGTPDSFAIGDFNHDGIADVVIHGSNSSSNSGAYYVILGTSNGTFDVANDIVSSDDSGYYPNTATMSFAVDDFNGDGYADLAYRTSDGIIGISLNPGSSSPANFSTYSSLPSPAPAPVGAVSPFHPDAITSGHLTSSGHADLVVAGLNQTATATNSAVAVYLGNGDGTFSNPTLTSAESLSTSLLPANVKMLVKTADLRKSGVSDVIVATQISNISSAAPTYGGDIVVLTNNGSGALSIASTITPGEAPNDLVVADFNGDGYPDIVVSGYNGSLFLYINDGTGKFGTPTTVIGPGGLSFPFVVSGDFNSDGLPDLLQGGSNITGGGGAYLFLNSESSQATFVTPAQSLPAGSHTLTATFAGDNNLATATSAGLALSVTQSPTTISWPPPAAIEYGTPLGPSQLDAVGSVPGTLTYTPGPGALLPPGQNTIAALFAPTDSFDYAPARTTQSITVSGPSLSNIVPTSASLGAPATTITVNGQGFLSGAVVSFNGTPLSTTWISLNQVTAIVPASMLTNLGVATITILDPNKVAVAGSATFTISPATAVAQVVVAPTVEAGQNSEINLTVSPYPIAITPVLTLNFTPAPPNTTGDPTVGFSNGSTSITLAPIPANSTAAIPPIPFSAGSTAGTITLTTQFFSIQNGATTPISSNLQPTVISIPASPPSIISVVLIRGQNSLTLEITGISSTREMTDAHFHFAAAPGKTLDTQDLVVQLSPPFSAYYQSSASTFAGTAFLYTQPFTLSSDSSSVGSVTVTLENGVGVSQAVTAQ